MGKGTAAPIFNTGSLRYAIMKCQESSVIIKCKKMIKHKTLMVDNQILDVDTGEIKAGKCNVTLRSSTIGSCVVIASYSLKRKVGVLAHVMVPGKSPDASRNTKYAVDAIDELVSLMAGYGIKSGDIEVCLVGGANVLKEKNETICKNNIDSVINYLKEKKIKIKVKALGGTERRSITFDIAKGHIYYTEGESAEKLLWKVGHNNGKRKKA